MKGSIYVLYFVIATKMVSIYFLFNQGFPTYGFFPRITHKPNLQDSPHNQRGQSLQLEKRSHGYCDHCLVEGGFFRHTQIDSSDCTFQIGPLYFVERHEHVIGRHFLGSSDVSPIQNGYQSSEHFFHCMQQKSLS